MDDLLSEFLSETADNLEVLDSELVKLERNPNDPAIIGGIFRLLHTIKGTCGFLGLPRLETLAHAGENVLSLFRDGELEVSPEGVSLILESLDAIKALLAALRETGLEPAGDDQALIARLDAAARKATPSDSANAQPQKSSAESLFTAIGGHSAVDAACDIFYNKVLGDERLKRFFAHADMQRLKGMQHAFLTKALGGPDEYSGKDLALAHAHLVKAGLDDEHFNAVAEHLAATLAELAVPDDMSTSILEIVGSTRDAVFGRSAQDDPKKSAVPSASVTKKQPGEPQPETEGQPANVAQTIRVNVEVLENLMNVVSELVLTRNQLLQVLRSHPEREFEAPLQRLNQVTSELQESVMATRMQPIGNAWAKLPRIVRDLSIELGKRIELDMNGADTELDRQVLELIKDPLAHMVRNSADHGIELPSERLAAGKPEDGRITLSARHEGGQIVLEIADDGCGIPVQKVRAKALAAGFATESEIESMPDQQILQYIFKPGFSTASKVTNVSGRGVGMDVAKTNIEKIGGNIELISTEGKGSRFIIKIPLTLAIVSALIIECCGERFAIPQNSVIELVGTTGASRNAIEYLKGAPVLRLRDRLLPLVSLATVLGLERPNATETDAYIVVSQVGNFTFGIIVDRVYDTEEIVIKPVSRILRHLSLFSGNTILGDGSVIMILDPNGIAHACGEISVRGAETAASKPAESQASETVSLVVFRSGEGAPKAVPTALVSRLEEIDLARVEYAAGRPVIQYRGGLMSLLSLDGAPDLPREGRRPILVVSERDRTMGLMVSEIIDIIEQAVELKLAGNTDGVLGSAIIAGKATDMVDVAFFAARASEGWFGPKVPYQAEQAASRRVLVVDDSAFMRNVLSPLLAAAGYQVTVVESAEEALRLRESGKCFDAIVSDIEMPGMDGFSFASEVRRAGQWTQTPLIALSSHDTPRDIDRGRQAGFDHHIGKLDRGALLSSLSTALLGAGDAA